MQVPLIQLQCGVNSYEWGKKGRQSAAAKFAAATPSTTFTIQDDKPYAEVSPCQPRLLSWPCSTDSPGLDLG
jgi:Phosphomannose isomerase type I